MAKRNYDCMLNDQLNYPTATTSRIMDVNIPTDRLAESSTTTSSSDILRSSLGQFGHRMTGEGSASAPRERNRQSAGLAVRGSAGIQYTHTEAEWERVRPIIAKLYLTEG